MYIFSAIWLVLLGILAVPNLILSKKPNAKEILDKITPYQGWIGVASAIWGAFNLVRWLLNIRAMTVFPSIGFSVLGAAIVSLALGLLLGVGVMKTFINNDDAKKKLDQLVAKLAPKQGIFGLVSIGLGVWLIILRFAWTPY